MHEEVVHGFDVFGEESHCSSFLLGTPRAACGLFLAVTLWVRLLKFA
jgi:hypothetical protein